MYINPIGGLDIYEASAFSAHGIELRFLRARPFEYRQFGKPFVPWLSIIDVMMFNSEDQLQHMIRSGYDILQQN
jgi:hypothetical protein